MSRRTPVPSTRGNALNQDKDIFKKRTNNLDQFKQQFEQPNSSKQPPQGKKQMNNPQLAARGGAVNDLKKNLLKPSGPQLKKPNDQFLKDQGLFNKERFQRNKEAIRNQFERNQQSLSNHLKKDAQTKAKKFSGPEKENFEKKHAVVLNKIEVIVKKDLLELENNKIKLPQGMTMDAFLQLAFYYRSYQVCLEEDFYSKIVARIRKREEIIKTKALTQNSSLFSSERSEELKLLEGAPVLEAVQSLNYYEDFFNNLLEIQKIWPNAGEDIRWSEMRLMFAYQVYGDFNVLLNLLDDTNLEKYPEAANTFLSDFEQYFRHPDESDKKQYIQSGDGLNASKHPWEKEGLKRLRQANKPLDFKSILSETARHEVEDRVEHDKFGQQFK